MDINDDLKAEETPDAEMTEEQRAKKREKLTKRAMNVCMWHLGQGDKTEAELTKKLVKKEIPADIIESTLAELREQGFVDDERYAANFVRLRQDSRRQGSSVIRMEMRRKGVEDDIISEAMEEIDVDLERTNALELAQQKIRQTKGVDRQKRISRTVGMLARKGYSPGLAFEVVREALAEAEEIEEADAAEEEAAAEAEMQDSFE